MTPLLGVAISASLLPPAVNTGLYWAMAMMSYGFEDKLVDDGVQGISKIETKVGHSLSKQLASHGYHMTHSVYRGSSLSMRSTVTFPSSCSGAA